MESLYNNAKFIFEQNKSLSNLEVELRLGKKSTNMFDTNIGEQKFLKIKQALDNFTDWEKVETSNISSYFLKNIRYNVNDDTDESETIMKKKIKHFDQVLPEQPLDVRFAIAQEIPQPAPDLDNIEMDFMRCKSRTSYIRKNLTIDLTIVNGQPEDMDDEFDNSYEVELEIIDPTKVTNDKTFYNIIYKVFCILKTL